MFSKPQKLDSVVIKNALGQRVKKFVMGYGYYNVHRSFSTLTDQYRNYRLRLETFQEVGRDNTVLPPHAFYYKGFHDGRLRQEVDFPAKDSKARDLWGYYNAKNANDASTHYVPTFRYFAPDGQVLQSVGINRDTDTSAIQLGVLDRIDYPTAGYTSFDYESHTSLLTADSTVTYSASLNNSQDFTVPTSVACIQLSRVLSCNVDYPGAGGLPANQTACVMPNGTQQSDWYAKLEPIDQTPTASNSKTYLMSEIVPTFSITPNYGRHRVNGFEQLCGYSGRYRLKINPIIWQNGLNYSASLSITWLLSNQLVSRVGGGIRVKRISNYSVGTPAVEQRFSYNDSNGLPTGVRMSLPVFQHFESGNYVFGECGVSGIWTFKWSEITSSSQIPLGTAGSGSYVGYRQVSVSQGIDNGKTVYNYRTLPDGDNPPIPGSFSAFPGSQAFSNLRLSDFPADAYPSSGFLERQRIYRNDNRLLTDRTFEVDLIKSQPTFSIYGLRIKGFGFRDGFYSGEFLPRYYVVRAENWSKIRQTEKNFDPLTSDSSVVVTTYQYNASYLNLRRVVTQTDSKLRTQISQFTYPSDFTTEPVYQQMVSRNVISPVVVQTDSLLENGQRYLIQKQQTNYRQWHGVGAGGFIAPQSVDVQQATGTSENQITFLAYHPRGYPLAFTQQDGLNTTIDYWDDAPAPTNTGKRGLVRSQTMGSQTTYYDYQPLVGVESSSDASLKTTFYKYDAFNRLKELREDSPNGALLKSYCYNYAGQNVNCGGSLPSSFQQPRPIYLLTDSLNTQLSVLADTLFYSSSGGLQSFLVKVMGDSLTQNWLVNKETNTNWLTATPSNGRNNPIQIQVRVTDNFNKNPRVSILRVRSVELDTLIQVFVKQSGRCNYPKPTLSISDTIFCAGDSAKATVLSSCPANGKLYWSSGDSVLTTKYFRTSGRHWVICRSDTCISDTAFFRFQVVPQPPKPSIAVQGSLPVCQGLSANLVASGCPTGSQYHWTTGLTGASVSVNSSGKYWVHCRVGRMCKSDSATIDVLVIGGSLPVISVASNTVCQNQLFTLTAVGCSGAAKWFWDGIYRSTTPANVYSTSLEATTNFAVTCLNGTCSSGMSVSKTITVIPSPTVALAASANSTCESGSLQLSATASPMGSYSYAWRGPNGFISNTAQVNLTNVRANQSGYYKCIVGQGLCQTIDSVKVIVVSPSTVTSIKLPFYSPLCVDYDQPCKGTFTLQAEPTIIGGAYEWYRNSKKIDAETSSQLSIPVSWCAAPTPTKWLGVYQARFIASIGCPSLISAPYHVIQRPDSSVLISNNIVKIEFTPSTTAGIRAYGCADTLVWAKLYPNGFVDVSASVDSSFYFIVDSTCNNRFTDFKRVKNLSIRASASQATCQIPIVLRAVGCDNGQVNWYNKTHGIEMGNADSLVLRPPARSGAYYFECMDQELECLMGVSPIKTLTVDSSPCLNCLVDSVVQRYNQLALNPDVGWYNEQDSTYYGSKITERFLTGFKDEFGNCMAQERAIGYENALSVRFQTRWISPEGNNSLGTVRAALIIVKSDFFAAPPGYPYKQEMHWVLNDNGYITLNRRVKYSTRLYKAVPDNWPYPHPSDKPKCVEVSLSATGVFDSTSILIENAAQDRWFDQALPLDSIIATNRRFIVVRQRNCATLPTQMLVIDPQRSITDVCAPDRLVSLFFTNSTLPVCLYDAAAQGFLHWGYVDANNELVRINQGDFFGCQYPGRGFQFVAPFAGLYWVRLANNWWHWPTQETRFNVNFSHCN